MKQRNVVLLGIGHTNAHVVKQWASDPIPNCKLICISKFAMSSYSGMLPGTLGQQFREDEMRIDLEPLVRRAKAELILADVSALDLQAGEIHFEDHDSIRFDALSIGIGSVPSGWDDHRDTPSLVPIKPMQTFLQRLESRIESAECSREQKLPDAIRIAVVGGGVAGVEIALCLLQHLHRRSPSSAARVTIFTSGSHVANGMTPRSVRKIEQLLSRRGVHVFTGKRVETILDRELVTDDGEHHAADCVVWATGAAPPPLIERLGLQTDSRGFIATHKTLQSVSDSRIFAVGDCGTVIRSPSPKAGVYAVRQCPVLWHNLRALLEDGELKEFHPQANFLKLLNTGDGKAMLEYGGVTFHARWCWSLKTWIDERFIREFQFD